MLKIRNAFCWLVIVVVFAGVVVTVAQASVDPLDHIIFRSYSHSQIVLAGKVLDGHGTPVPGTGVTVYSYPLAGGAASGYTGTTDSDGHYHIYVRRGSSRLLVVSAAGETAKVKELVRPGSWLTIRTRGRGVLMFTGGVKAVGPLPTVLLQDRTPSGWRTFGAVNPNARSHLWRFRYHAGRQLVGYSFAFRVATLPNAAYLRGYSYAKTATVR